MTQIEELIKNIYRSAYMDRPDQVDMNELADHLNIKLIYDRIKSSSIENNGQQYIILDIRVSAERQWQEFGHEVGHLLRHVGNQRTLRDDFKEYQENQADSFMYHFCVPSFMLQDIDINPVRSIAVADISAVFGVHPLFAEKRLQMCERRYFERKLHRYLNNF